MKNSSNIEGGNGRLIAGIRPGFWLAAIAALCLCGLLATASFRLKAGRATRSATEPLPSSQLTTQTAIKSEVASRPTAGFDEKVVRLLACAVANARAKELYDCEPFNEQPPLRPEQTGWKWIARRAHGWGDFEATVQLGADGSVISTEVLRLVSPPDSNL